GREMLQRSLELGRTGCLTGAIIVGAFAGYRRAAHRALLRHPERLGASLTRDHDALRDGGNHVSSPLDLHRIADPDILAGYLVGVVQRGPADRHASHLDRLE